MIEAIDWLITSSVSGGRHNDVGRPCHVEVLEDSMVFGTTKLNLRHWHEAKRSLSEVAGDMSLVQSLCSQGCVGASE